MTNPFAALIGLDMEDVARAIYDAMRFERRDKTPDWVKGGNSNAQVEARATAARILAALEAAPVPDLGEAAAMVLGAMNDGEVWGRAVNAAMPIINADLDQSAWVTVSEVREALVAALRAMIDEARDD